MWRQNRGFCATTRARVSWVFWTYWRRVRFETSVMSHHTCSLWYALASGSPQNIIFTIATVTFRVLQYQQSSYLASLIPRYVPTRALRSSSSLSVCFPPRRTTMATSKSFSSVLRVYRMHCRIICRSSQFFRLLEELSNIIYSCLLTLTVVQNRIRSDQLSVSHFVIHRQPMPSHSPEIPCHPSGGVPSERLVKRFILHRLHTGAWVNLVIYTYSLIICVDATDDQHYIFY